MEMKRGYLGVVFIIVGLLGILLIASNFKMIGFVVQNSENDSFSLPQEFVNNSNLQMSKMSDVIVYPGDKNNFYVDVTNIGNISESNCYLIGDGDIKNWTYMNDTKSIYRGQKVSFGFLLDIPENTSIQDYIGEISVKCDDIILSQNFSISVLQGLESVKIGDIQNTGNGLNISYSFNSADFIGDGISMDIWLTGANDVEVTRVRDSFPLNQDIIQRNIFMQLPNNLVGIYYVNFALSSDTPNYIRQSVVIGQQSDTVGYDILDQPQGNQIGYGIFVLIIIVGVIFIIKNYFHDGSSEDREEKRSKPKKNQYEDVDEDMM